MNNEITHDYSFYAEITVDKSYEQSNDIASIMRYIHNKVGCVLEFLDVSSNDENYMTISFEVECEVDIDGHHDFGDAVTVDMHEVISQIRLINFVDDVVEI